MKLINRKTKQEVEAQILEIEEQDFEIIKKSKQFSFDWKKEKPNHIFKLVMFDSEEIQGLLSITNISEEFRIHINLIENSNSNKGKNKIFDKVAGCLLAFAVQLAFEEGYLGFTSLVPKTELISLYVSKYGFTQYGQQLAIEKKEAIHLIKKYL